MKLVKGTALIRLAKPLYGAESLGAGALRLGRRAKVYLVEKKGEFSVEIAPAEPLAPEALRALAGEFLNEALSHEYRQRVVQAHAPLSQAVLGPLFAKGFPAVPADPLEELEPQVRADRQRDLEDLLAQARKLT